MPFWCVILEYETELGTSLHKPSRQPGQLLLARGAGARERAASARVGGELLLLCYLDVIPVFGHCSLRHCSRQPGQLLIWQCDARISVELS